MDDPHDHSSRNISHVPADPLLQSWKEIAKYLGVSTRTAQAWERQFALPVYREGVGKKARVIARRHELDSWRERRRSSRDPARESRDNVVKTGASGEFRFGSRLLSRRAALLALILMLGCIAVVSSFVFRSRSVPKDPVKWTVDGGRLRFFDAKGRLCWQFEPRSTIPQLLERYRVMPQPTGTVWRMDRVMVRDLEGDGRTEVLLEDSNEDSRRDTLLCFNFDGTLRWRHQHGKPVTRRGRSFDAAYRCSWTLGPFKDRERSYLLTSAANTYFPQQLALIDVVTGQVVQEYWHPGALDSALAYDIDSDGKMEVLAAGVNNPDEGTGHPAFVVLDIPFRPSRPGTRDQFGNPGGQETAYLLLPKIDVVNTGGLFTAARLKAITDDAVIQLAVERVPSDDHAFFAVYRLGFDLHLIDFRPSDGCREGHRRLERQGLLDHSLTQAEIDSWGAVKFFSVAPDGNSDEVDKLWSTRPVQP